MFLRKSHPLRSASNKLTAILVWGSTILLLIFLTLVGKSIDKQNLLLSFYYGDSGKNIQIKKASRFIGSKSLSGEAIAVTKDSVYILGNKENDEVNNQSSSKNMDILVLRLDRNTGELLSSISFGGSDNENGADIQVEQSGTVLIAGTTTSNDFPVAKYQSGIDHSTTSRRVSDLFITRLSGDLSTIRSSKLIRGNGYDKVKEILIHPNGQIYLVGNTNSTDFPTTEHTYQRELNTPKDIDVDYGADGFILLLNQSIDVIISATYFGGSRDDYPYKVNLTESGNIIVAGNTASDDYPTIATEKKFYGTTVPSRSRVFISILDPSLKTLIASVVLGSPNMDYLRALTIDKQGKVHVCGHTATRQFPVTQDAIGKRSMGGYYDIFYNVLTGDLEEIVYSTLISAGNSQSCVDMFIEGEYLYLFANTKSTEWLGGTGDYPGEILNGTAVLQVSKENILVLASIAGMGKTSIGEGLYIDNSIYMTGTTYSQEGVFKNKMIGRSPAKDSSNNNKLIFLNIDVNLTPNM